MPTGTQHLLSSENIYKSSIRPPLCLTNCFCLLVCEDTNEDASCPFWKEVLNLKEIKNYD